MWRFQLVFLSLLYVGYSASAWLYVILNIHIIAPTDPLHPSPTQHIKTSRVFFIYFLNVTTLFTPYYLLSNLSKDFQHFAQYRTDESKILTNSVPIPTCYSGGHYRHQGTHLAIQQRCAASFWVTKMRCGLYYQVITRKRVFYNCVLAHKMISMIVVVVATTELWRNMECLFENFIIFMCQFCIY